MTKPEPHTSSAPILLVPRDGLKTVDVLQALREAHDITGTIYAVDFYVEGAERWDATEGGWHHPAHPILNVDHHAPHASMQRKVSSANLALDLIHADAKPRSGDAVVISHMDCDSVLAAGILTGRLEPHTRYGEAAIAADHTGTAHPLAELLQGLDAHWSRSGRPMPDATGLEYFFDCLTRLERDEPLDDFAREALDRRTRGRDTAAEIARSRVQIDRRVAFAALDEPIEGELLLPALSEAWIVATANPHRAAPDTQWQIKVRLTGSAPSWLSLHDLDLRSFDRAYGGRWNAGSNNRGGGTTLLPEEYRHNLIQALDARLLEHAIALAVEAHKGQRDKACAPYILHPLRVMATCTSVDAQIVGVLHDVVEDSPWTIEQLGAEGFSADVLVGIEGVTALPQEEAQPGDSRERRLERYLAFCVRAATHPLSREVKLADLADNLDEGRLTEITDKDLERLDRYRRGKQAIERTHAARDVARQERQRAVPRISTLPHSKSGDQGCVLELDGELGDELRNPGAHWDTTSASKIEATRRKILGGGV